MSGNFVLYIRYHKVGLQRSNVTASNQYGISFEFRPVLLIQPGSTRVFADTTNTEYYLTQATSLSTPSIIHYHTL